MGALLGAGEGEGDPPEIVRAGHAPRLSRWRSRGQMPKSTPVTEKPDSPDRFNEEKATYSVRGAGAPDLEAGVAAIRRRW